MTAIRTGEMLRGVWSMGGGVNWEAVSAVGELVGAIGVIVTLGFLAYQIRQNSSLIRTNTRQLEQNQDIAIAEALGHSNAQQAAMLAIGQDVALSDLFFRGLRGYEDLAPAERMRFALVMGPLIAGVSTQFERQLKLGLLDDGRLAEHIVFVTDFISTPGGRAWWKRYRNRYHAAFRDAVDDALNAVGNSA
ncbi:MAG: hypothetical protein H6994_00510 [Pseudomonadales bacterium]|nr:hypothetical protein [Pseudomonadales bacterium]